MQKPNIFRIDSEELIKKTKDALIKFDFRPYAKRLVIGWLIFLVMVFSLLSTITLALTIWP